MKTVSTSKAPLPAGHYSQAVVCGGVVYVAGQMAKNPRDPDAHPGTAGQQTKQALANVGAVLEAAGSSLRHLLQVTVFVTDIALWSEVNEAYAEVLGEHRPARAIVPIGPLPGDYVLEIQASAALP
jgi:2-iminobutanoate/2-iminopropanoate deaminase